MTDLEIAIENAGQQAEQRAVERTLEAIADVLFDMRNAGDARDGTFERFFEQRIRAALKKEQHR